VANTVPLAYRRSATRQETEAETPYELLAEPSSDGVTFRVTPMRTALFAAVALLSVVVVTAGDARSPAPSKLIVFASNRGPNVENTELYSVRLDGTRRRALSRSQGPDSAAAPSPNGRRIAFAGARLEHGNLVYGLYVMQADGTGQRRLTPKGFSVGGDAHPSWSPDGSEIAFAADGESGYGVHVVRVDGTGLRVIAPWGFAPTWAPSGSRIAFVFRESRDLRQLSRIATVSAEGGDPVVLTDDHVDGLPVWSPDGSLLAFVRSDAPHGSSLSAVDSKGGAVREVLSRPIPIASVSWPAPNRLVLVSGAILAVSPTGAGLRRLAAGGSPALSPDRREIAYVRGRSIAVVGINGGRIRKVLDTGKEYLPDGPVWIAGGRLAFSSIANDPPDYDLWVADSRGGRLRQLTRTPVNEGLPQWSPDHRRLAFVRNASGASHGTIWVSDTQASNARRIASGGSPSWSPDGRRLAFSSRRAIYTISVDSGSARRVVAGSSPSWSPHGRRIAFVRGSSVLMVDLGSRSVRTLIDLDPLLRCEDVGATVEVPEWSPGGKELVVYGLCDRGRSGSAVVVVVNADGSQSRILPTAAKRSRPAWAPDGERIAFEQTFANGSMLVTVRPHGSSSRTVTWSAADDRDPDW
jgi:Tol biopolymer transport system component